MAAGDWPGGGAVSRAGMELRGWARNRHLGAQGCSWDGGDGHMGRVQACRASWAPSRSRGVQARHGCGRGAGVELEALETQVQSSYHGAPRRPGRMFPARRACWAQPPGHGAIGAALWRSAIAQPGGPSTRTAHLAADLVGSGGPTATEGGQHRGCMLRATRLVARPSCSSAQSWQRAVPCRRPFWRVAATRAEVSPPSSIAVKAI